MSKRFIFAVEGRGIFPFDMLRYDACWPSCEFFDSAAVAGHFDEGRRTVTLATHNPSAPTVGRWNSFGWRVVEVTGDGQSFFQGPEDQPLSDTVATIKHAVCELVAAAESAGWDVGDNKRVLDNGREANARLAKMRIVP